MLPDVEMSYAQNHLRDVSYFDYYQFSLKNIASGESFNHLVSNGISNLKAVLIVPMLNSLNNNVNAFDDGFAGSPAGTLRASVYVGDTCHDSTQKSVTNNGLSTGGVGKQVELWVPAYQMLPDVEMSYAQNHLRDVSYLTTTNSVLKMLLLAKVLTIS